MGRTLLLLAVLAVAGAARAAPQERIVLVPFDDLSRAPGAREPVARAIGEALRRKGYEVVGGDAVEGALRARRVRYLDSLPTGLLAQLADEHAAGFVMTGSILEYARDLARVVLVARIVAADGALLWTGISAVSGADGTRVLGRVELGDVGEAVAVAVARLLAPAPRPAAPWPVRVTERSWRSGVRQFRAPGFGAGEPRRIALLPFESHADDRDAPRVVETLLRARLGERPGFEVVEPADLRAALVAEGVRDFARVTPEQLQAVAKRVGTPLFARGMIFGFGGAEASSSRAEVEVYASIVDVDRARVAWSALHGRDGAHYEGLLGVGAIRSRIALADRVVAELVDALCQD